VGPPVLKSISIAPANSAIPKGLTQQFAATGTFSDASTQNVSGAVTWASSAIGVATIAPGGLASSVVPGNTTITATSGSLSASTVLNVDPPVLQSFTITSSRTTIPKGQTQQLVATGMYSDGARDISNLVQWKSGTTAATVSATGLLTAVAVGPLPI